VLCGAPGYVQPLIVSAFGKVAFMGKGLLCHPLKRPDGLNHTRRFAD